LSTSQSISPHFEMAMKNGDDPADYVKRLEAQLAESQRRESEYRQRIDTLEFRLDKVCCVSE
jgi:septal ring factor EnvC (AmiA/AmiB activator)